MLRIHDIMTFPGSCHQISFTGKSADGREIEDLLVAEDGIEVEPVAESPLVYHMKVAGTTRLRLFQLLESHSDLELLATH